MFCPTKYWQYPSIIERIIEINKLTVKYFNKYLLLSRRNQTANTKTGNLIYDKLDFIEKNISDEKRDEITKKI